ncbi:MAG: hypothetical protein SCH98_15035 [Deferrisomatales bacterium]|nr:hypothetical protein [Deferrisomatales bacterium]
MARHVRISHRHVIPLGEVFFIKEDAAHALRMCCCSDVRCGLKLCNSTSVEFKLEGDISLPDTKVFAGIVASSPAFLGHPCTIAVE